MGVVTYKGEGFYISYLAKPSELATMLDLMAHAMGNPPPTGQDETAICAEDGNFYILYGNHVEAYNELGPKGLKACMDYFIEHIHLIGHSSDKPELSS